MQGLFLFPFELGCVLVALASCIGADCPAGNTLEPSASISCARSIEASAPRLSSGAISRCPPQPPPVAHRGRALAPPK